MTKREQNAFELLYYYVHAPTSSYKLCNFFIRPEYRLFLWKYCMLTLIFYTDQSNLKYAKFMRSILKTETILVVYMHMTLQFHFYENGKNGIHKIITLNNIFILIHFCIFLSENYQDSFFGGSQGETSHFGFLCCLDIEI